MPSKSIRSTGTSKTVRTVDDVFSQLENDLDVYASLHDSRDRIRKLTFNNSMLEKQSIDELHNPLSILSPVAMNPSHLIKSMFANGVLLGGVQATSFFYPLCQFSDAPWDFFCSNKDGADESFINSLTESGVLEHIEEVNASNGVRVMYYRRTMNGVEQPINIRVYICEDNPLQCILSQTMSYQQSYISAVGAVCFWPRLNRKRLCRQFDTNASRLSFPSGKTKCKINIKRMSVAVPKKTSDTPSIYTGHDDRIEIVTFKNVCNLDKKLFEKQVHSMQSIVYAVSNTSTKYLGDISEM